MTRDEYSQTRAALGQALRELRWERRALGLIFRDTRDPDLIRIGSEWMGELVRQDIRLSREIIRLDVQFRIGG